MSAARSGAPLVAALALALAATLGAGPTAHAQEHPGKPIYDRWCAECHGFEGRGDGPAAAWMLPRPRDFTQARYQIRTTPSGAIPTDDDILRVIERGMPGTAMPGWPKLAQRDKAALVEYLKTFSHFFESEGAPQPLATSRRPRASAAVIAEGRQLFEQLECAKCHGEAGRGDGPSAPTQEDDNGWPIRPADLTQNWRFNGGGSVDDIYMRLLSGLDGTPMPSSADLVEAGVVTEAQLWSVAHYVRSLSPEKPPAPREVIRAVLRPDALPGGPADPAWDDVPAAYIPLVGQIIEPPRWFSPTVHTVWVQAAHDGEELVIRLSWTDPSRSPDAAWEPWRQRVVEVMEPSDEAPPEGPLPDAFAVQFAAGGGAARDLPYFLMGDARAPVYLWRWSSDGAASEALARGLGRIEPLAVTDGAVHGEASHQNGEWRLVLRRSLVVGGPEERTTFRPGDPAPIAFYAWDGSNGEAGRRVAIGSWYFILLEEPVTANVYIVPLATVLITALLAVALTRHAQRAASSRRAAPVAGAAPAGP